MSGRKASEFYFFFAGCNAGGDKEAGVSGKRLTAGKKRKLYSGSSSGQAILVRSKSTILAHEYVATSPTLAALNNQSLDEGVFKRPRAPLASSRNRRLTPQDESDSALSAKASNFYEDERSYPLTLFFTNNIQ